MNSHIPECLARSAQIQAAAAAWSARWPDHCRECQGWGAFNEDDPCSCAEDGFCPRCGKEGLTSEDRGDKSTGEGPCAVCGWDWGTGKPTQHECLCGEARS